MQPQRLATHFECHAIDDVDFCAEEGDILEIAYKSGMLVFIDIDMEPVWTNE